MAIHTLHPESAPATPESAAELLSKLRDQSEETASLLGRIGSLLHALDCALDDLDGFTDARNDAERVVAGGRAFDFLNLIKSDLEAASASNTAVLHRAFDLRNKLDA